QTARAGWSASRRSSMVIAERSCGRSGTCRRGGGWSGSGRPDTAPDTPGPTEGASPFAEWQAPSLVVGSAVPRSRWVLIACSFLLIRAASSSSSHCSCHRPIFSQPLSKRVATLRVVGGKRHQFLVGPASARPAVGQGDLLRLGRIIQLAVVAERTVQGLGQVVQGSDKERGRTARRVADLQPEDRLGRLRGQGAVLGPVVAERLQGAV